MKTAAAQKAEKRSFQEILEWFFIGYSMTQSEKVLYFIKRLVWIGFVCAAIRYAVQLVYGLCTGGGPTALSLLIPAGIAGAAAFLFFRFD